MPSIRSCLASLAIMALAFSPIAAAASPKTGSLVARSANNVARSQVKASAALARRAAKKTQEKRSRKARVAKAKANAGGAAAGADPYAANSRFLNTKAALVARSVRCNGPSDPNTGNARCNRALNMPNTAAGETPVPENGVAVCASGRCSFRCKPGFAPGGSDGTQCVAAANQCGSNTCQVFEGGFNTCSAEGACVPGCLNGSAPQQNSAGTIRCFDTTNDPANCGAINNVCPPPYSGDGVSTCSRGRCGIACTAGTFPRRAQTGEIYCY